MFSSRYRTFFFNMIKSFIGRDENMDNYDLLNNDKELNNIIDSINKVNENSLFACHGRYHFTFVIKTIEELLTKLNYGEDIIELGKIAGLLHDIGAVEGKKGHAQRSSEMCIHFLDKTTLSQENKNIIIHAVEDHSNGDEINSPVGAALLFADKIDLSKNRVLELGKQDHFHNNLLNVEEVILKVEDKNIIINYIVNDRFSREIFEEWEKAITIPIKASTYLGCNCIFQFNGEM